MLSNSQQRDVAGIVADDYPLLRRYLGDLKFKELLHDYVLSPTAARKSVRRLSRHLPDFLKSYSAFDRCPEIQELSDLECACNLAFEAIEAPKLTISALEEKKSVNFSGLALAPHPSVSSLTFTQNTTSIWSALKCDEQPPKPHHLDEIQHVLVWRQGKASRFRILGQEEATAFDRIKSGRSFRALCKALDPTPGGETPMKRATAYLRGWVDAELLLATEEAS
jgi:hypothetical protein